MSASKARVTRREPVPVLSERACRLVAALAGLDVRTVRRALVGGARPRSDATAWGVLGAARGARPSLDKADRVELDRLVGLRMKEWNRTGKGRAR